MHKVNKRGFTLVEALVSMVILGFCAILISGMVSSMKNNTTSIRSTRGLYSVMQNVLETYQIDVTRQRDIGTGSTTITKEFDGREVLNEVTVSRAKMINGEPLYIISIKTYSSDRPKHFVADTVIMSRGVGINAE